MIKSRPPLASVMMINVNIIPHRLLLLLHKRIHEEFPYLQITLFFCSKSSLHPKSFKYLRKDESDLETAKKSFTNKKLNEHFHRRRRRRQHTGREDFFESLSASMKIISHSHIFLCLFYQR